MPCGPTIPRDLDAKRLELLTDEYVALREDERQWNGRAISLGSLYLVVVATTAFFLLKEGHRPSSAATHVSGSHFPGWVYAAAPIPSFCITAMLARQAVTSTIRGRLLFEIEAILGRAGGTFSLTATDRVPLRFSYRAQQLWLQGWRGWRGRTLAMLEGFPLVLIAGLCYSSFTFISEQWAKWAAVGLYTAFGVGLLAVALPGIAQTLCGNRSTMLKRTTLSQFASEMTTEGAVS
jgi:hypothetical protein